MNDSLSLTGLIVLVLAVDFLLVSWFKGAIFANCRANAEAWQASTSSIKWFFGEMFSCSKCLPFYLALGVYLTIQLLTVCQTGWHIINVLAIAGLSSRLYNGLNLVMFRPLE